MRPIDTLRMFFALAPTAAQKLEAVAQAAPLVAQLQGQPVPVANVHATVLFVGAIPPEKLDALRAVAAEVRARPISLTFDVIEHWETPKILCATSSRDSSVASPLMMSLAEATIAAGFSPDIKPFRAHLTLARKISAEQAEKFSWPQPLASSIVMRCEEFLLMQSRRDESGSVYSAVDSWPLYD